MSDNEQICLWVNSSTFLKILRCQMSLKLDERIEMFRNVLLNCHHLLQIEQVKQLLNDLQDPETGEFPEIAFDRENEDLVVEIKGTDWIKVEAQKRLASLT